MIVDVISEGFRGGRLGGRGMSAFKGKARSLGMKKPGVLKNKSVKSIGRGLKSGFKTAGGLFKGAVSGLGGLASSIGGLALDSFDLDSFDFPKYRYGITQQLLLVGGGILVAVIGACFAGGAQLLGRGPAQSLPGSISSYGLQGSYGATGYGTGYSGLIYGAGTYSQPSYYSPAANVYESLY
ncbi:unnamed protein product [Enterobius vermicularis]|uniref:Uncharacterized protein n=1 Tax=Enterobius vermicularis TaxID=51028 RepID=A0A0N4VI96_ENTVE|nr:unnamed protein product [Enterobius vermicularis]